MNASPFRAFEDEAGPEALEAFVIRGCEVFLVSRRKPNGFYGFPNNFVEKAVGVSATTRNWSTVTRIASMTREQVGVSKKRAGEAGPEPEHEPRSDNLEE